MNELDGFVHEREYGPYTEEQRQSVLARGRDRPDPIFDYHKDNCECETCSFARTCRRVMDLPCYGAIWNTQTINLTVFVRWPDFKTVKLTR